MQQFPGDENSNYDAFLASITEMLKQMKKEQNPHYHALYCYFQCAKGSTMFADEEKSDNTAILDTTGRELRNYFVHTPLKQVHQRESELEDEIPGNDLIALFSSIKSDLHLSLATLVEDELFIERNTIIQKNLAYSFLKDYPSIDETHDFNDTDIRLINYTKFRIYEEILLRDYFRNASGKSGLSRFIDDARYEGSLFVALLETGNRTLPKTVTTWKDRFRLYQLIERYITFCPDYEDDREDVVRSIMEFGVKMLRVDCYQHPSKKAKLSMIQITLGGLIKKYESSEHKRNYDWIMEYVLCCLTPCNITNDAIMLDETLESMGLKMDADTKRICEGLWNIVFDDRPMLDELGFYGTYTGRFTMEEFRIREYALELLEDHEIKDGKKMLKQLQHHQEFFRYQFNIYSIHFREYIFKAVMHSEAKQTSLAVKSLESAKQTLHEWRSYIINNYPQQEIKKKLTQIDDNDYSIQKVGHAIYGTTFDEAEYFKKKTAERATIQRNDPCPCGSTKKYKKCCG